MLSPAIRLSNLYFWFFALLGALIPYWSLYLEARGFSYLQIATLMAILQGTKIVAPNLWGWLGDHSGRRLLLVRMGAILATACFLGVFLEPGLLGMVLVVFAFSFFWNAILPLYEVITLHNLGADRHRYSQVRLWGSIGFIVAVGGAGLLLEWVPVVNLPWILMPVFLGIVVSAFGVRHEPNTRRQPEHGSLKGILKQPEVVAFFAMNFLLQASHGPYYTFFSIHLKSLGYNEASVGALWSLGVIAEILLFLVMHRVLGRFTLRRIALVAMALTVLRWILIASSSDELPVLLFAQLLHAASFGAMHAISIHFIHSHFGVGHQGQGQALYSGLSFGAGGATGAWLAGVLVDTGDTSWAFWGSASMAMLGVFVIWFGLRLRAGMEYAR
ncbi:MFS transporter [Marinobacteraceae bacterium S3BR75-40.1]